MAEEGGEEGAGVGLDGFKEESVDVGAVVAFPDAKEAFVGPGGFDDGEDTGVGGEGETVGWAEVVAVERVFLNVASAVGGATAGGWVSSGIFFGAFGGELVVKVGSIRVVRFVTRFLLQKKANC